MCEYKKSWAIHRPTGLVAVFLVFIFVSFTTSNSMSSSNEFLSFILIISAIPKSIMRPCEYVDSAQGTEWATNNWPDLLTCFSTYRKPGPEDSTSTCRTELLPGTGNIRRCIVINSLAASWTRGLLVQNPVWIIWMNGYRSTSNCVYYVNSVPIEASNMAELSNWHRKYKHWRMLLITKIVTNNGSMSLRRNVQPCHWADYNRKRNTSDATRMFKLLFYTDLDHQWMINNVLRWMLRDLV